MNTMTSQMIVYIIAAVFIVGLIVYFMYHRWNKKRRGEDHNAKANTEASEILNHRYNQYK